MSSILSTQKVRDAVTKTAKLLSRNKVEVRQQGAKPHVAYGRDGRVLYVNLPAIPDQPPEEFLFALQGFLDHEVAHVLFTNFLDCQKGPERARAEGMNFQAASGLANGFEDIRIEREMSREFRGSASNFSKSLLFVLEKSIEPALKVGKSKPEGHERTLAIIYATLMPWMRAQAGDTDAQGFMDKHDLWPTFTMVSAAFPSFVDRVTGMKTSEDAGNLAYDFMVAMTPKAPPKEDLPPPPFDCSSEDSDGEPREDEEEGEGDEKSEDGEGAGGSEEESESDTHEADDEAPEDDTPEEDDTVSPEDEDEPPPFGDEDDTADEDEDEDAPAEEEEPGEDEEGEDDGDDEESSDEEGDDVKGGKDGKTNLSLTQAMKKLDPAQRRALFLYNNKRKTVRAISEAMRISQEDVADTMRSGRRALKKLMGKG